MLDGSIIERCVYLRFDGEPWSIIDGWLVTLKAIEHADASFQVTSRLVQIVVKGADRKRSRR